MYVDPPSRRAFVACEDNARLAVVDLASHRQLSLQKVGSDPDVLALDDAGLAAAAEREMRPLLGISREPVVRGVYRWLEATPQMDVGHLERVAAH